MLKDQEEKKYSCRFCNKSFPSGRTLGGHMRGHLAAKEEEGKQSKSNAGYALRENPKKSWKFSTINPNSGCKVCGKEFESMRALFGHMRHHSGKEKKGFACKEWYLGVSNESRTSSSSGLILESLADSDTTNLARRKRSKRMRYKSTPTSSFSSFNESSSVTEIEEEVEDVAFCLMMLSKGVGNWGRFNMVCASPVNVSLSFDAKPLDQGKGILRNETRFACDGDQGFKKKRPNGKLGSCVSECSNGIWDKKTDEWIEFGIGTDPDEEKKLVPEASMEVCRGLKMPNLNDDESRFVMYDTEMEKKVQSKGEVIAGAGLKAVKSSSCKTAGFDHYDTKSVTNSLGKTQCSSSESGVQDDPRKKCEFQCRICNKVFQSYQALGGHQTLHRPNKGCISPRSDNHEENLQQPDMVSETEFNRKFEGIDENSSGLVEINGGTLRGYVARESKEHKCPVCFKLFTSGQALGGHKRAHHLKNSKSRVLMRQDFPGIERAIDLNLPAMVDEEGNGDVGFKPDMSSWLLTEKF